MGNLKVTSYQVTEFELPCGGEIVKVLYKQGADHGSSYLSFTDGAGKAVDIPQELFVGMVEAIKEVNPFLFAADEDMFGGEDA